MLKAKQPIGRVFCKEKEDITVDVSWPEPGQTGFAICNIVVKRGDKVVSKSRLKVQVAEWQMSGLPPTMTGA